MSEQLERFMVRSRAYWTYAKAQDDVLRRFLSSIAPGHYPIVPPFLIIYSRIHLKKKTTMALLLKIRGVLCFFYCFLFWLFILCILASTGNYKQNMICLSETFYHAYLLVAKVCLMMTINTSLLLAYLTYKS